jgi:hypothetical protein
VDLNGDGNIDLLTASYSGLSHIFYGKKDGSLKEAVVLKDKSGAVINLGGYYDFKAKKNIEVEAERSNFIKACDWDNDGDLDLLISSDYGVYLRINEGTKTKAVFGTKNINVVSGGCHADVIIDWDGDGLWDILGGSKKGGAYFYKNTGKLGSPSFGEVQSLIEPSELINEKDGFCGLTKIAVTDYNNDGKLDLIIGADIFTNIYHKLTAEELNKRMELEKERDELLKKMRPYWTDFNKKYGSDFIKRDEAIKKDEKFLKINKEYKELMRKLTFQHGYVFLSLRKSRL